LPKLGTLSNWATCPKAWGGAVLAHQPRQGARIFRLYRAKIVSKESPGLVPPGLHSVSAPRLLSPGQALKLTAEWMENYGE